MTNVIDFKKKNLKKMQYIINDLSGFMNEPRVSSAVSRLQEIYQEMEKL